MRDIIENILEHPEFEEQRQRAEQAEQKVEELEGVIAEKDVYIDDSESSIDKEMSLLNEIKGLTISQTIVEIEEKKPTVFGISKDYGTMDTIVSFLKELTPETEIVKVEVEVLPREVERAIKRAIEVLSEL